MHAHQDSVIKSQLLSILSIIILNVHLISPQQDMCPKSCKCNEENLEVRCNLPFNAYGLPHTLNPMTKRLIVNYAQTTHLSSSDLSSYPQLEVLDLAFNKLTNIDFDYIRSNINLISLNASHNNIHEIKDSAVLNAINKSSSSDGNLDESEIFRGLKKSRINVIELSLSRNLLTVIKNYTFTSWHKLQRLDLSYNTITTLESNALVGLTRLEYLNLKYNQLAQVPSTSFIATTKPLTYSTSSETPDSPLRIIDLSNNALVSIGANSFKSMARVQELYLEHTLLQFIDSEAFNGLDGISLLSVNDNDLTDIPSESFKSLTSLKHLKLSSNKITRLQSNAFIYLQNLEELQMSNGSLNIIDQGAFNGLHQLKRIELAHNPNLTIIPAGALDKLSKLDYLSLNSNSMTSVPEFPSVRNELPPVVDLRHNRLTCDCDLKWLTRWLVAFNETLRGYNGADATIAYQPDLRKVLDDSTLANEILALSCFKPPALEGKLVSELPDNKLECLTPDSDLHVHIGFLSLFLMTLVLTTICTVNFCRNEKRIMGILKENLAQSRIMLPAYTEQDTMKSGENLKAETRLDGTEYESVNYSQNYWPVYTISNDQFSGAGPSHNN